MREIHLTEADVQRFRGYLARDSETGCLLWTGAKDRDGYGRFALHGRPELAHRVAWLIAGRRLEDDKPFILHDCPAGDNRACCEIAHLWAGTQASNIADMARKGRGHLSRGGLPFGAKRTRHGTFAARITFQGRRLYFGTYQTAAEASRVALAMKRILFDKLQTCREPLRKEPCMTKVYRVTQKYTHQECGIYAATTAAHAAKLAEEDVLIKLGPKLGTTYLRMGFDVAEVGERSDDHIGATIP